MVKWRIERGVVQQTESLVRGFYEVKTISSRRSLQSDINDATIHLIVLTCVDDFCCVYCCSLHAKSSIFFPLYFKSTKRSLTHCYERSLK